MHSGESWNKSESICWGRVGNKWCELVMVVEVWVGVLSVLVSLIASTY